MDDKFILSFIGKFLIIMYTFSFFSCDNSINNKDELIGTKINFMQHAVDLHNINANQAIPSFEKEFKIVTYVDLYCSPCWQSIMPWKEHLNDFKQYKNVSFICYVNAMPNDFEVENKKAKLDFPVLLDTRNRFRVVNKLGNNPSRLTFLLNKKNEIILVGQPFTPEMK